MYLSAVTVRVLTGAVQIVQELIRLRCENPRPNGLVELLGVMRTTHGRSGRGVALSLCYERSLRVVEGGEALQAVSSVVGAGRVRGRACTSSSAWRSGSRSSSCVNAGPKERNFFCPGAAAPPPARASESRAENFSQKEARARSANDLETSARMAVEQDRTRVQPCSLLGGVWGGAENSGTSGEGVRSDTAEREACVQPRAAQMKGDGGLRRAGSWRIEGRRPRSSSCGGRQRRRSRRRRQAEAALRRAR